MLKTKEGESMYLITALFRQENISSDFAVDNEMRTAAKLSEKIVEKKVKI